MLVVAVSFAIASTVHFGAVIPLGPITLDDPFSGAAVPEGILAIVLAIGAISVIARWRLCWQIALGTTLFAFLVTIYGLTVTLSSNRTGDVEYHISILLAMAVILILLLLPAGRRALSR
jgi:hypothetical protein